MRGSWLEDSPGKKKKKKKSVSETPFQKQAGCGGTGL
jgi:hypothetical protein